MRRMIVMTTPDLATGYRLAGVATMVVDSPEETAERLCELIDVDQEKGIIAVHEPFFDALESRLQQRLDESTSPLVVALPGGETLAGPSARRARLQRLLWQAVGYEMTFRPTGSGSP